MKYPHLNEVPRVITVRKIRVGWTVNGRYCLTFKSQQRQIARIRRVHGHLPVRTPG